MKFFTSFYVTHVNILYEIILISLTTIEFLPIIKVIYLDPIINDNFLFFFLELLPILFKIAASKLTLEKFYIKCRTSYCSINKLSYFHLINILELFFIDGVVSLLIIELRPYNLNNHISLSMNFSRSVLFRCCTPLSVL